MRPHAGACGIQDTWPRSCGAPFLPVPTITGTPPAHLGAIASGSLPAQLEGRTALLAVTVRLNRRGALLSRLRRLAPVARPRIQVAARTAQAASKPAPALGWPLAVGPLDASAASPGWKGGEPHVCLRPYSRQRGRMQRSSPRQKLSLAEQYQQQRQRVHVSPRHARRGAGVDVRRRQPLHGVTFVPPATLPTSDPEGGPAQRVQGGPRP